MPETLFAGRRAYSIENDSVRVTVSIEGGHVAEILDKQSGVNPLWIPPWRSIEPSAFDPSNREYGADSESKLLAGILGHNLCLDVFGSPSEEEAAQGMTVHGEGSIVPYTISGDAQQLQMDADLPIAQMHFHRTIRLEGNTIHFSESVENLAPLDRPIAWTEHVTLGPPFLEKGSTQFRVSGSKSYSLDTDCDFEWPHAPLPHSGTEDLRVFTSREVSGGFTTHLMDPSRERAYFFAYSPTSHVLLGYVWKRADFPWLGMWDENYGRTSPPWNNRTLTRGMEFGASPLPESRRKMIDRNTFLGAQAYRWLPAKSTLRADYTAFIRSADSIPETLEELQVSIPA